MLNILRSPFGILTSIRDEFGALVFFQRNFAQNQKLRKEIDLLRNKLNAQQEINLENARLKELVSFKQNSAFKVIAARVIGRAADSWSSCIIVDKGRRNGINKGMVAITYLGLAGRVIEAKDSVSKILLINDPGISVSALVQRSRQEGLVSGTLGSNLIMSYLPEDADIKVQDEIVTSGLNEIFPKGLLIGKVTDTGKEFSGLSRYAVIKPAVNLFSVEEVLIIVQ